MNATSALNEAIAKPTIRGSHSSAKVANADAATASAKHASVVLT
jgi:hypothetical protein